MRACVHRCMDACVSVCLSCGGWGDRQSDGNALTEQEPTGLAHRCVSTGKNGVVSVYDYEYAQDTWTALQGIKARV